MRCVILFHAFHPSPVAIHCRLVLVPINSSDCGERLSKQQEFKFILTGDWRGLPPGNPSSMVIWIWIISRQWDIEFHGVSTNKRQWWRSVSERAQYDWHIRGIPRATHRGALSKTKKKFQIKRKQAEVVSKTNYRRNASPRAHDSLAKLASRDGVGGRNFSRVAAGSVNETPNYCNENQLFLSRFILNWKYKLVWLSATGRRMSQKSQKQWNGTEKAEGTRNERKHNCVNNKSFSSPLKSLWHRSP